jgi:hypothetical protein
MACGLLKMATNDNVADSVKLTVIRDALDRAALMTRTAVEVEVGPPKPYEQILDGIMVLEGGSRDASGTAGLEGVNRTLFLGTSPTHPQHLTWIISLRLYLIVSLNCSKGVDLQRMSLSLSFASHNASARSRALLASEILAVSRGASGHILGTLTVQRGQFC